MKRLFHSLGAEPSFATAFVEAARAIGQAPDAEAATLAAVLAAAYPALAAQVTRRPGDVLDLRRDNLRIARDLRAYRRIAASLIPGLVDAVAVRRGLRVFVQRERLRIAARELLVDGAELDATARELADLAEVSIEIALAEAQGWAEARFGAPLKASGERCAFTVLGMGKLGGRELNAGSDVDLIPFYETDEGSVVREGVALEQTLNEHFARVTQRFTSALEDATEEGLAWRVDLRLRPEGSRGPLVNALPAAERYYETWGRTWERAALLRARPIAGDRAFGERLLEALSPFVWRRAVDPRIAREMADLAARARAELSADPERDLKLGPGGIREAEFFVQSLQLIWGGREPMLREPNTLAALRRLRARGYVNDRETRELEAAYLSLRRVEHRVQNATGVQTHVLPRGDLLERIARSLGFASGHDLERDLEKVRRRVGARLASLTRPAPGSGEADAGLAPLLAAIDAAAEPAVIAALSDGALGESGAPLASADFARQLLALARRPDFPLGAATRDRHPALARTLLEALAGAADPEQSARLLAAFFARLAVPSLYVKAMADDPRVLRKLVGLFGASAFLGEALVFHPELVESVLFTSETPTEERARAEVELELAEAERMTSEASDDPEELFVGALRRAKARILMRVGLSELAGEISTRAAGVVVSAVADAILEHATARSLSQRGLRGGLAVIGMGKLGGRELGYGSDLDIFFVHDGADADGELGPKYVRAAQRVLTLVSAPHGDGPGYELDTRLRPSGSHGLLVVSVDAFARYHGLTAEGSSRGPEGLDWERQALVKARLCAGDPEVGRRVLEIAARAAYERGAPDPERVHHLRMRMERELAREAPRRFDVKLGRGGIVDVEFAVQWLQMKHGRDPRVRTPDTEGAIGALEACAWLDPGTAAVLREGYTFLRRLEQGLRMVHGTSRNLIEEGAEGLVALARRMGFRDAHQNAAAALLARYRVVTAEVRATYARILGLAASD